MIEDNQWNECVEGILCNPIYVGIGPYEKIIEEDQWIRVASMQIEKEGADKFLKQMLFMLRESFAKRDCEWVLTRCD